MKKYLYRLWQWLYKGIPVMKVNAGITTIESPNILTGKKIIVTGGSKGIGYHIAKKFIESGAEVVIVGRNEDELIKSSSELNCKWLRYDLTNIDGLDKLVQRAAELMGGLTGLVNNAGICNIDNGFLNVSQKSYDEQFLLNVKSPFFLTQAFIKYIVEHKIESSGVVFITSERGLYPDDAPYGMTKAAIGNIISGIARQFAVKGVHINGIAPGVTADILNHPEMCDDLYLKGSVGKRFILPTELAEVASFLMSDASRCVSGEIIPCNQANHYK